jgi:hypothetical protein
MAALSHHWSVVLIHPIGRKVGIYSEPYTVRMGKMLSVLRRGNVWVFGAVRGKNR